MTKAILALVLLLAGCSSTHLTTRGTLRVYTFTHDSTNAHLVVRDGSMLLIDSGYERNAADLAQDIRAAGFEPKLIKAVVLTHGHADHAGGARYFQQHFGTPVVSGAGDGQMLAAGHNEKLCPTGFLGKLRRRKDQRATFSSTHADRQISAPLGLTEVAGMEGSIVPLPGHTKGSLVVLIDDVAFVGDLLRGSLVGHSAEMHLYQCEQEQNRRDVTQLLGKLAPSAQLFMVGHFGPVERESVVDEFGP